MPNNKNSEPNILITLGKILKMAIDTKDSTGKALENGDTVQLTRDLKVKGSSTNLKRGTAIKNIRLTNNSDEVECRIGKSTIVLRTEYLKKK